MKWHEKKKKKKIITKLYAGFTHTDTRKILLSREKKKSGMTNMTTAVMLNEFSTSDVMFFVVTKSDICFTPFLQANNFAK